MAVATARKPDDGKTDRKHNIEAMRQEYYERIARRDIAPLRTVMSTLVPDESVTRCKPVTWHYDDVNSLVAESGSPITAEEAKPSGVRVK